MKLMWHWRILGFLFLGTGAIGIVVPVMPTTIFWIFAALCFARSDPKIRDWIYARPGVGPQVELFAEHGQMTRAGKRGALIGMTIAAGIMAWALWGRWIALAVGTAILMVGACVVLTRPIGHVPASPPPRA